MPWSLLSVFWLRKLMPGATGRHFGGSSSISSGHIWLQIATLGPKFLSRGCQPEVYSAKASKCSVVYADGHYFQQFQEGLLVWHKRHHYITLIISFMCAYAASTAITSWKYCKFQRCPVFGHLERDRPMLAGYFQSGSLAHTKCPAFINLYVCSPGAVGVIDALTAI